MSRRQGPRGARTSCATAERSPAGRGQELRCNRAPTARSVLSRPLRQTARTSLTRRSLMLVAHLSDSHLTTGSWARSRPRGWCWRSVGPSRLQPRPDVLLISGDLVERGTSEEYEALREVLARSPLPVHLATGNHDRRVPLLAAFAGTAHLPAWTLSVTPVVGGSGTSSRVRRRGWSCWTPSSKRAGSSGRCARRPAGTRAAEAGSRGAGARNPSRTPTLLVLHHPPIHVGIPFRTPWGCWTPTTCGRCWSGTRRCAGCWLAVTSTGR